MNPLDSASRILWRIGAKRAWVPEDSDTQNIGLDEFENFTKIVADCSGIFPVH